MQRAAQQSNRQFVFPFREVVEPQEPATPFLSGDAVTSGRVQAVDDETPNG